MTTPTSRIFSLRNTGIAIALAAAGFVGYQAVAETKSAQHAIVAAKHGGWGGGAMTPEEMDKRIERMVAHAAIEIEASDEQQTKITAIAKAAAAELRPLRDAMRELREHGPTSSRSRRVRDDRPGTRFVSGLEDDESSRA